MPDQAENPPTLGESPRVFVSHSSSDAVTALGLCSAMEGLGRPCWIAPRNIAEGVSYAGNITKAIREASSVVLVFSAAACRSDHVLREIDVAANAGTPVVAVRLEDIPPSDDLAFYIGKDQWVDALRPPIEKHVPAVVAALTRSEAARRDREAGRGAVEWKPPRERVVAELSVDLSRYQDITLKLKATLEDATSVLVRDPAAREAFLQATLAYNAFSPGFIARLPSYRASVRKYWSDGLLGAFDELALLVEHGIYRGALFGLNPVRVRLNEFFTADAPDAAAFASLDRDKRPPLATLTDRLHELATLSAALLGRLERAL